MADGLSQHRTMSTSQQGDTADTADEGDTVQVHYTGTLPSGETFDSSRDRDPLEFTLGQGQMIPGFEEIVVGMEIGETKEETIPVDKAYGPRREDLVFKVEKDQLPDDLEPEVGDILTVQHPSGQQGQVQVQEIGEEALTLDGNHPLAGEDLTFEVELVEIS